LILRHEYLTANGRALYPILVTLMQWGDRYGGLTPQGAN
jgi:DNA-binding HxlR family transcriptional regulator